MWRRAGFGLLAVPLAAVGVLATGVRPEAVVVLYLAGVTPWLARYDVREHRLPNVLVLPGIGVAVLASAGEWAETGRVPVVPLMAAGIYAGFLFLLNLLGGMGMGDVKLAAALGLASWNGAVAVLSPVAAFLVGGLVSVVLLIAGRRGRRIAFGPFLLGGFWVAVALVAASHMWEVRL
jgi:leader peptidase (prepilin peptidase) / N-methyltransferase